MLRQCKNSGFTLIELVIVIAIIGILAAVAIPKFISLTSNANTAATTSVAGALSSANTTNFTARTINSSLGIAVTNCNSLAAALQGGALPTGYAITSLAIAAGATSVCTLTGPGGVTATFSATGIS